MKTKIVIFLAFFLCFLATLPVKPAFADAPVANEDTAITDEDTPVTIDVLANDTDDGLPNPPGALSVQSVGTPTDGNAVINPDNTVTYTPNLNFNGTDSFTYIANDGSDSSNVATVTVTVNAVDDLLQATDDSASTQEDTPVSINVLSNDTLGDEPTTITATTNGTNGTVAINGGDTSVTYTPNANFNGTDSFTYTIRDSDGDTSTATVTVTVNAVDDLLQANNDSTSTQEDTPVSINVLSNDTLGDEPTTITATTNGTNGTVAINGDDTSVTYTPNANFNGTDSFTYTIRDSDGDTSTATVTVTVNAVDDLLQANNDSTSTQEDTPVSINVLSNDTLGDQPTTITSKTNGSNGTVAINAGTSVTYTPNANFNGTDNFTYTITDDDGDTSTATVTVTVNAVDDLLQATDDSTSTQEDTPVTIDVLSNDTLGDEPTTITATTNGTNGTVAINGGDTSVTYTPNANFNGTDNFTYTITDDDGDTDTATVTITVTAVNDPPVATDDSYSTNEDTTLNITAPGVLANDTDPDGGGPLTAVKVSDPTNGTLTLNSVGSFTYTPNADFSGTDSFTYKANDGTSDSNVATVNITVNPVNDPPLANDDSYTTDEDTTLNITAPGVLGNDSDPDDGDILTAAKVSDPTNGTLTLNSVGSFTYTPNADFSGTDSFTYRANDGTSDSNVATVNITISPVPDAPVANDDAYTTDEDTTLILAAPGGVLANDTDADGDPLTAILQNGPSKGFLTLNSSGSFSYKPNLNFFGTDYFTYTAGDGQGGTDTATVTITVNSVNDPPIADAGPDQTVGEGSTVILVGSNSFDIEGQNLSYQWDRIAGPSVSLSNPQAANPTFRAPSAGGPGGETLTLRLTVADQQGAQTTDNVIINVTLPLANRPPEADAGTDQNVEEADTVTLNGSNSFDADGDNLSYQWDQISGPLVTLLPNPTAVNPTFKAPFVDSAAGVSFTFELTVTDTSGLQATDTTIVNVASILLAANQPPGADVGDDQTVDEDETVTLNGSNSFDPEGGNLFYRWRQVAGRPVTLSDPTAEQPSFSAPNVGLIGLTLVFELTVTDIGGLQAAVDTLVNVAGDDDAPTADAGDDQTVDENTPTTLDGSGSFDPELEILSYSWRQRAGPSVTLTNPAVEKPTFTAPNVTPNGIMLNFELFVTDVVGQQRRDDVEITVFGSNDQPIADAGDDQTVLEKTAVMLDASNSFDPDVDDIMTYQWNQTEGKAVTLSDPTSKLPTFEAPVFEDAGDQPLIFELIVTDGQGEQSQADSTTVTVSNFEKKNPGASGGGCFIATATYGSSMDSHVNLSREFRDRFLLTNPLGEEFLKLYYTYSPPLADLVAKHETLRKVVRFSLLPFAAMAYVMLYVGAAKSSLIVATLLTILLLTRIALSKRRGCRSIVP